MTMLAEATAAVEASLQAGRLPTHPVEVSCGGATLGGLLQRFVDAREELGEGVLSVQNRIAEEAVGRHLGEGDQLQ